MLQQKFTVQVTTLPDCDDITRFDGTSFAFHPHTILLPPLSSCLPSLIPIPLSPTYFHPPLPSPVYLLVICLPLSLFLSLSHSCSSLFLPPIVLFSSISFYSHFFFHSPSCSCPIIPPIIPFVLFTFDHHHASSPSLLSPPFFSSSLSLPFATSMPFFSTSLPFSSITLLL